LTGRDEVLNGDFADGGVVVATLVCDEAQSQMLVERREEREMSVQVQ
jgi:hypothetical protein